MTANPPASNVNALAALAGSISGAAAGLLNSNDGNLSEALAVVTTASDMINMPKIFLFTTFSELKLRADDNLTVANRVRKSVSCAIKLSVP